MQSIERAIIEQSNEEVYGHLYLSTQYTQAKAVSLKERVLLLLAVLESWKIVESKQINF